MTGVHDCRLVDLPLIGRPEGNITPLAGGVDVPFAIERVYYLYDIPGGAYRGGHAHRGLHQLLVSAMGAFTVVLKDGSEERRVELNRAYRGLHVPPMIWREIENFSAGSICLVLASAGYDEDDYLRDYDEFVAEKGALAGAC